MTANAAAPIGRLIQKITVKRRQSAFCRAPEVSPDGTPAAELRRPERLGTRELTGPVDFRESTAEKRAERSADEDNELED